MGNVMTPFFPPKAAFIPKLVNLLASGPYTSTFYVDITAAQAENNIFYLSGSATNAGTTGTSAFVFFNLPTTTLTKVYTFSAGNITLATTLYSYSLGITTGKAGASVEFGSNMSFQVVYSASGYGGAGAPTVRIVTASTIYFST
jgi:hypothetical protein